jgi:hypothetical protein
MAKSVTSKKEADIAADLETQNPEHPYGGKWCRQCGRAYPVPGHTADCRLINLQNQEKEKEAES